MLRRLLIFVSCLARLTLSSPAPQEPPPLAEAHDPRSPGENETEDVVLRPGFQVFAVQGREAVPVEPSVLSSLLSKNPRLSPDKKKVVALEPTGPALSKDQLQEITSGDAALVLRLNDVDQVLAKKRERMLEDEWREPPPRAKDPEPVARMTIRFGDNIPRRTPKLDDSNQDQRNQPSLSRKWPEELVARSPPARDRTFLGDGMEAYNLGTLHAISALRAPDPGKKVPQNSRVHRMPDEFLTEKRVQHDTLASGPSSLWSATLPDPSEMEPSQDTGDYQEPEMRIFDQVLKLGFPAEPINNNLPQTHLHPHPHPPPSLPFLHPLAAVATETRTGEGLSREVLHREVEEEDPHLPVVQSEGWKTALIVVASIFSVFLFGFLLLVVGVVCYKGSMFGTAAAKKPSERWSNATLPDSDPPLDAFGPERKPQRPSSPWSFRPQATYAPPPPSPTPSQRLAHTSHSLPHTPTSASPLPLPRGGEAAHMAKMSSQTAGKSSSSSSTSSLGGSSSSSTSSTDTTTTTTTDTSTTSTSSPEEMKGGCDVGFLSQQPIPPFPFPLPPKQTQRLPTLVNCGKEMARPGSRPVTPWGGGGEGRWSEPTPSHYAMPPPAGGRGLSIMSPPSYPPFPPPLAGQPREALFGRGAGGAPSKHKKRCPLFQQSSLHHHPNV